MREKRGTVKDTEAGKGLTNRWLGVLVAGALGLAVVGFMVGIRPMPRPDTETPAPAPTEAVEGTMPTTPYRELRFRRAGSSGQVTSDLASLRTGFPAIYKAVPRSPEDKAGTLTDRSSRRAFDGAPPVVPHVTDQRDSGSCLACHAMGIRVGNHTAPVISHPQLTNCTQCHVSASETPPWTSTARTVENRFAGRPSPGPGLRAWEGAPPTIPHTTWMRENCAACHGLTGHPGIRTTHPERISCNQCHASSIPSAP